jgi:hypothetical protein
MSPSTLRYEPRDDGNGRLRERLTELAGQHRRSGGLFSVRASPWNASCNTSKCNTAWQ